MRKICEQTDEKSFVNHLFSKFYGQTNFLMWVLCFIDVGDNISLFAMFNIFDKKEYRFCYST